MSKGNGEAFMGDVGALKGGSVQSRVIVSK